jgi:hypothetical protein
VSVLGLFTIPVGVVLALWLTRNRPPSGARADPQHSLTIQRHPLTVDLDSAEPSSTT